MAEAEVGSTWPPPPPFYKAGGPRTPPAPVQSEFVMYGVLRSTEPPAAPELAEQLYSPTAHPCEELRKLNRLLLSSFLELLQNMEQSPTTCIEKGMLHPRVAQAMRPPALGHA